MAGILAYRRYTQLLHVARQALVIAQRWGMPRRLDDYNGAKSCYGKAGRQACKHGIAWVGATAEAQEKPSKPSVEEKVQRAISVP